MKVSVDFKELLNALSFSNVILSDKSVDDKMKSVIFKVGKDSVSVVGYNPLTLSKVELETVTVVGVDEDWEFQVRASELNKILASFNSLYKTKVNSLDFEKDGVKIKLTVHEEALEEEDSRLSQNSVFLLENAPILSNIKKDIQMTMPDDCDTISSGDLLIYVDSLFPILDNSTVNGMGSKLNFMDDYVFVISSYASAFFVNKLPDAFKELTLGYSSVSFLKKLCESVEEVIISKTENHLCIQAGNVEAFMRYQKVKVKYQVYVQKMSKDVGIVVDRLYLKDVLKRMGNLSNDGKMIVGEDLEVVNSSFNQMVPIVNKKEGSDGVSFKFSVPFIEKCIIGSDSVFTGDIFMYFVDSGRGYILYLMDKSGTWFSSVRVSKV